MSYHNRSLELQICRPTNAEIERLLHHMPAVARNAENTWAQGFALSVSRQSRRRNWKPSPKQLSIMRGLVTDLFTHAPATDQGGDIQLIED
jgi:hypothetical protein